MPGAVLIVESDIIKGKKVPLTYRSVEDMVDTLAAAKLLEGVVGWDLRAMGYHNGEEDEREAYTRRAQVHAHPVDAPPSGAPEKTTEEVLAEILAFNAENMKRFGPKWYDPLVSGWIRVVDCLTARWPHVNEWILVHTTPNDF